MPMSDRAEVAVSESCAATLMKIGVPTLQVTVWPVYGVYVVPSNENSVTSADATLTSFEVQLLVGSASVVTLLTPDVAPELKASAARQAPSLLNGWPSAKLGSVAGVRSDLGGVILSPHDASNPSAAASVQ